MKKQFEEDFTHDALNKFEDDLIWKKKQKLKKRILTSIEKLDSQEKNKNPILSTRSKKENLIKRLAYSGIALMILFGLFIGSAFLSPAMAEVVSKIPYLGQLIKTKPIVNVIAEELKEKDYQIAGIGVSYQEKKEISVTIQGSTSYYNDVKDDVEQMVKDILKSRNYNAYTVKVSKYQEYEPNISKTDQKRIEVSTILSDAITKELEKHNYNILSSNVVYNRFDQYIELEIPKSEPASQVDEIKKVISKVVQTNNVGTFPIEVKKIDLKKREQDGRWAEILSLVGEDLMGKEEFKVTGLGYSVYPEPELIIKTSINSSDANAKEFGKNLEKIIDEFLKSKEMKSKVKSDLYIITVRSKDKKKIN